MRTLCLALLTFLLSSIHLFGNLQPGMLQSGPYVTDPEGGPQYVAEEVQERLREMSCLVETRYDRVVEAYITGYVVRHRERTAQILGRMAQYFPLFEEMLRENDMPEELKYLAVVESALNPKAVSRVGATGLWQFMEDTGRHYGLDINAQVDERSDPVKSTQAAIKYLRKQYDRFGSWDLALAAYNSGPGRVNRAIRRSRSRNFWKLRRYLPRETRNYVPAFIAATYLCKYYDQHQIKPEAIRLDYILTDRIMVHEDLPFYRIAQITGLPLSEIEALNPSYQLGYIPGNRQGNYLTLPRRVLPAVEDYLAIKQNGDLPTGLQWANVLTFEPLGYDSDQLYYSAIYVVQEDDTLEGLARLFRCSVHALEMWNDLDTKEIRPGQELILFYPKEILRFEKRIMQPLDMLPSPPIFIPTTVPHYDPYVLNPLLEQNRRFFIYRAYGGETLRHVSALHGYSLNVLISNNPRINADEVLREGQRIRIPKSEY